MKEPIDELKAIVSRARRKISYRERMLDNWVYVPDEAEDFVHSTVGCDCPRCRARMDYSKETP